MNVLFVLCNSGYVSLASCESTVRTETNLARVEQEAKCAVLLPSYLLLDVAYNTVVVNEISFPFHFVLSDFSRNLVLFFIQ